MKAGAGRFVISTILAPRIVSCLDIRPGVVANASNGTKSTKSTKGTKGTKGTKV